MSIEEKLAIHEMIAQYSYTYDASDPEGFAQVFAEDSVFEIFVPGKTTPSVRLQSRTRFASGLSSDYKRVSDDSLAVTTNPVLCLMG